MSGLASLLREQQLLAGLVFYIAAPRYLPSSSGIRCLFLLCDRLNRLGYRAFVTGPGAPAGLHAPIVDKREIAANRRAGVKEIVIYPETVAGNPLSGSRVVRYLLNKPGFISDVGMESYGSDEFFVHFADEFRPEGLRSLSLALPLIDREIYRLADPQPPRDGFLLYANRSEPNLSTIPDWVSPTTLLSMSNRRTLEELAVLYQCSRALVLHERSAAGIEALCCGCPVIAIPNAAYDPSPTVARLRGNGMAVGWDVAALRRATETTAAAIDAYDDVYRDADEQVHAFVRQAVAYFARRA